ncbi:MAG: hypothetical protein ACRC3B_23680 [Bacteroidia bacterium]
MRHSAFHALISGCAALLLLLANSCNELPEKKVSPVRKRPPQGYMYLNNGKFEIDGKTFFPKLLNCAFVLRVSGDSLWPALAPEYSKNVNQHEVVQPPGKSIAELRATLQLVHDLGYNSIRICGIGEPGLMPQKDTGYLSLRSIDDDGRDVRYPLNSEKQYTRWFACLKTLTDAVDAAGLKAIFLSRTQPFNTRAHEHLRRVAVFTKPLTSIMAVDFFNEPLYFDSLKYKSKVFVTDEVVKWQQIFIAANPYHLTTIGLANETEVTVWDPNLMDVDFLSFHPYEYAPEMVNNELYWYSRYVKKPWIVGETGLSAENITVPYATQTTFTKRTFEQACNCGAIGYSLWQLKDMPSGYFHQQYLGVMNNDSFTVNSKGDTVSGTPKPLNDFISKAAAAKTGNCFQSANYYNYFGDSTYTLTGFVFDNESTGLEGAIVTVWDITWMNTRYTHTRSDGSYELNCPFEPYYICFSATLMETQRNDVKDVIKDKSSGKNINTVDDVQLEPVELK